MTIAEKVLKKLSELDEKLDSVYETADAIKYLKLTIERFQKEAEDTFSNQVAGMDTAKQNNKKLLEDYETALGNCEIKLNSLKKDFLKELDGLNEQKNHLDLSIQALEQRKQELDEDIESILTVYTDEQKKIDAALTLLGITKLDLSTLEGKLTQAFSGLDNTISNKLSKYIDALDSKLEPIVIGHLNKLDGEIARFKKEIDAKIDKNLNDQNEQLDGWINNKEVWLQTQQEESKKLIVQIKSSEANLTSKVNELTKQANDDLKDFKRETLFQGQSFQKEINTKIDNKLQELSEIETKVTIFISKSMNEAAAQLKDTIDRRLDQLELRQTQFLEHQRALVDQLIHSTPEFRNNLSLLSKKTNELKEIDELRSQENISLLVRIKALEEMPKTRSWPFGKK